MSNGLMTIEHLLECLKTEAELLQAMLSQLRLQQQALVAGDQAVMVASSQQAESLLPSLQAATEARQDAQAGFASLDEVLDRIQGLREKTQFKVCLQTLRQGSQELALLQKRNLALIEQGLGWVDATLTSFVHLQQNGQPAVYGARGSEASDWSQERSMCDFNA